MIIKNKKIGCCYLKTKKWLLFCLKTYYIFWFFYDGTQPDAEIRSYEDYDWVQGRMVQYRRNDNDGLDRF